MLQPNYTMKLGSPYCQCPYLGNNRWGGGNSPPPPHTHLVFLRDLWNHRSREAGPLRVFSAVQKKCTGGLLVIPHGTLGSPFPCRMCCPVCDSKNRLPKATCKLLLISLKNNLKDPNERRSGQSRGEMGLGECINRCKEGRSSTFFL